MRQWEQLPKDQGGSIEPTEVDGPRGRQRYPYDCAISPTTRCEPLVQTAADRMVGEIAQGAGRRVMRLGHGGGKRR